MLMVLWFQFLQEVVIEDTIETKEEIKMEVDEPVPAVAAVEEEPETKVCWTHLLSQSGRQEQYDNPQSREVQDSVL